MATETNLCVGGDLDGMRHAPGRNRPWFKVRKRQPMPIIPPPDMDAEMAADEILIYEEAKFVNVVNQKMYTYWKLNTLTDFEADRRFMGHVMINLEK